METNNRVASIDIGLENLFTVAFNYNKKGISIKGSKLKSINQYFNKMKSKLQSLLINNNYITNAIKQLLYKREEQLRNYIGYYTNKLVELLKMENIKKLVVGYNKGWKQEINIGSKNNQNFVSIPFRKILNILRYKLEDNGIEYIEQEESYISKASYDDIPICERRIKRGLYKTKEEKTINADLKGFKYNVESLNIKKGETRCISNIIIEKESEISIKSGSILCIIKEN
ncbi:transposase [Fusobacterium polymorphum]|uniref:transposase n=1 Tax=Fusobacterium nucleatum subsp. polymorphum TaxID=76857 RepID=UPI003008209C